jgi:hypothetical protein
MLRPEIVSAPSGDCLRSVHKSRQNKLESILADWQSGVIGRGASSEHA